MINPANDPTGYYASQQQAPAPEPQYSIEDYQGGFDAGQSGGPPPPGMSPSYYQGYTAGQAKRRDLVSGNPMWKQLGFNSAAEWEAAGSPDMESINYGAQHGNAYDQSLLAPNMYERTLMGLVHNTQPPPQPPFINNILPPALQLPTPAPTPAPVPPIGAQQPSIPRPRPVTDSSAFTGQASQPIQFQATGAENYVGIGVDGIHGKGFMNAGPVGVFDLNTGALRGVMGEAGGEKLISQPIKAEHPIPERSRRLLAMMSA